MKLQLLVTCLLAVLTGQQSSAKNPNVLFIAVDDLNDWAGYRGNSEVLTPNMDRLAKKGTWFSKAYCQYPVCGPSRASLMTGLYFHQLESKKLQVKDDYVKEKVESMGSALLHDYMKQHGDYKSMAVGKILHRHLPTESLDMSGKRGNWNHNKDPNGKDLESNWKSKKTLTDWAPYTGLESEMSDSKAAAWAVERLQEKHAKPFMLMVGFLRPHTPWHVPKKYFDLYDLDNINLPPYRQDDLQDVPEAGKAIINKGYPRTQWAKQEKQWKKILQGYYASISFADSKVGQVLDALEASPYNDNTIVILWSDHGYHMGEKNTFQKHTLWERSASTPVIISLPKSMGGENHVGRSDRIVSLIDIYPTLIELCGLPPNPKAVGRSLKPLLMNRQAKWDFPALTYRKGGSKSIRNERYRYIQYGDASTELYDHHQDPNEWNNLAKDPAYADVIEFMRKELVKYHIE